MNVAGRLRTGVQPGELGQPASRASAGRMGRRSKGGGTEEESAGFVKYWM